jgi:type VI secretion system protein ImpH
MADPDRATPHFLTLIERFAAKPHAFGFFQAARRIEGASPGRPRIGRSLHAADDAVRFGQAPEMTFAPATIKEVVVAENRPPRIIGYFLGLFGPNGALPLHLTEYARDRQRNVNDPTIVRFIDVFHHRMLSLFYRAWTNPRPTVQYDRPESDHFATYVGAMFGIGQPGLRDRDAVPDQAKLHFAGLLAGQTRHAAGLAAILQGYFGMPVQIVEFVGGWLEIPVDSQWRLGESADNALGLSLTVGGRVWGRHHKFRIAFGPLTLADYERLLPGGDSLKRLVPLVRAYVGHELTWDVNLILKEAEAPRVSLGTYGRLGWTTWLPRRQTGADLDDLKLNPLLSAA